MTSSGLGPKSESQSFGSAGGHRRSSSPGSIPLTAGEMRAAHLEWADSQTISTECMFCGWTFGGTAAECRGAALEHRQVEHPEACIRRPRPKGSRISKRKLRTAGEEEQIKVDAAEANRLRGEREVADMLAKVERGLARERSVEASLDNAATGV